jgi:cysteine desulfurase/selenocysteine lyase
MIAFGFLKKNLKPGDEILINKAEHASNVLPYMVLEKEIGIKVKYVPLDENHEITVDNVLKSITDKTKVIAMAYVSNVVGDIRPIEEIGRICEDKNIYFIVDASQAVSHIEVNVEKCKMSFMAFSAHKMMGPTGVGVLYGKYNLLEKMEPLQYGGGMNQYFEEVLLLLSFLLYLKET